jgi:hypothetical protein
MSESPKVRSHWPDGNLHVTDREKNPICIFDGEGPSLQFAFGTPIAPANGMCWLSADGVSPDRTVYVNVRENDLTVSFPIARF